MLKWVSWPANVYRVETLGRVICLGFWLYLFFVFFTIGYIDLSKRRVSPEEIQKCEEKYSKAKTVRERVCVCVCVCLCMHVCVCTCVTV